MKKKKRSAETPYDEQKLRDEVRYLHSLWLIGPPPNPNQPPKKKKKMAATMEPDSGSPWPCPKVTPSPSGWPETGPVYPPVTAQDLETHSALRIQLRACKVFREFCNSSDDDGEDEEEDHWIGRGEEKLRFFMKIFTEDEELRKYYEANREGGDYCCFVCGAIGKGRRFRSCTALAQHSAAMAKGEKNRSHSAFGLTVCMVLGWDFDRLPSVVLKGEPLGRSLDNSGAEKLGEKVSGIVKDNNGGDTVEKDGIHVVRTDDGKDETALSVMGNNKVKEDDNLDESVDKVGIENLHVDDGKCSKDDEDGVEDPSEEEEEPSDEGDEEEDPSEEEENPSQNNDEEEDQSEDGDEHERRAKMIQPC